MRVRVLLAAVLVSLSCLSTTVKANGLPLQHFSPGSTSLWPAEEPVAAILSEDLSIAFAELPRVGGGEVTVVAQYRIVLNDSNPRDMPVAFVVDGDWKTWDITLDGESLEIESAGEVDIEGVNLKKRMYDPLTGEEYVMDLYGGEGYRVRRATVFDVHLEPGELHDLVVKHVGRTGWDDYRYFNTTYHYSYFLSPASKWASFGDLTLTISVPPGCRWKTSLDDYLENIEPGVFKGVFSSLPDEDLHISLMSKSGIWFGFATRRQALWLWLSGMALYVAGCFSGMRWHRTLTAIGFILISYWVFSRKIFFYPFGIFQMPLFAVILLAVVIVEVRYRRRLPMHKARSM